MAHDASSVKRSLVIFDCWGTLFYNKKAYIADIAQLLGTSIEDRNFIQAFERQVMLQPRAANALLGPFTSLATEYGKGVDVAAACVTLLLDARPTQTAYTDTIAVLQQLRSHYQLAMITNTSQATFEHLRELYPIDTLFDLVVTSYETGLMKPDSRVFQYALKTLQLPAERAVMVGDSLEADYNGAQAAGLRVVLLDRTNRYPKITDKLTDLTTLPDWLEQHSL